MSDLIERLRDKEYISYSTMHEAADEIERLQALHLERTKTTLDALVKRDKEIERLTAERDDLQYCNDFCGKTIERLETELKQANAVVEAAREWQANCKTFGLLPDAKLQEALAALETEPSMPVLECGCGESTCTDCAALETDDE